MRLGGIQLTPLPHTLPPPGLQAIKYSSNDTLEILPLTVLSLSLSVTFPTVNALKRFN